MAKGKTRKEIHEDYEAFVEKFKPKLTTDDCYTPAPVYDELIRWINERIMDLTGAEIVRPFWPGGDYENYNYPSDCVVIDNPPFSILAKIYRFYNSRNIKYFLFAPSLTTFGTIGTSKDTTCICAHASITYENGAVVRTNFITNLLDGEPRVMVAGDLFQRMEAIQKRQAKSKRKIIYPDHVITSATLGRIAVRGVCVNFSANDCHFVRKLDNMQGALYGGGFLLSERAAAERAAAERAALSDSEWEIIKSLGHHGNEQGR